MKWEYKKYLISDDKEHLDIDVIHGFLQDAYWCKGISKKVVEKSLDNSLCFGVYFKGDFVGFGRAITDYATFGYLADVFILEDHRRQGLAKKLVTCIMGHPELQGFRRWILGTRDAHGLYKTLAFTPLKNPEIFMEKHNPNAYK